MRIAVIALACLAAASALPTRVLDPMIPSFVAWKTKYEKVYESEHEEQSRFEIFKQNAAFVMEHNLRESLGLETFDLELNIFADLTNEEFAEPRLFQITPEFSSPLPQFTGKGASPPSTQDWVSQGWVTPVKDQGQCGSCWSFSATGSLEGQYFNSTGKKNLVSFSEQEQVSCNNWCFACQGGNVDTAFHFWTKVYGANTESDYPYTSGTTEKKGTCEEASKTQITNLKSHVDVQSGSESALEAAVGLVGPISVAIDATGAKFQLYKSGIYTNSACSSTQLDHAVLTVGYNQNSQGQYWIVKNSWGTSWGMNGYIWMAKNDNNMCGIATDASYPIV